MTPERQDAIRLKLRANRVLVAWGTWYVADSGEGEKFVALEKAMMALGNELRRQRERK